MEYSQSLYSLNVLFSVLVSMAESSKVVQEHRNAVWERL